MLRARRPRLRSRSPNSTYSIRPQVRLAASSFQQPVAALIPGAHGKPAVSVLLFGSFARGTADAESDIDIMVIRADNVDEDSEQWGPSIEGFRRSVESLSGSSVDLLEVTESRAVDALTAGNGLWREIATERITIFGTDLASHRVRRPRGLRG